MKLSYGLEGAVTVEGKPAELPVALGVNRTVAAMLLAFSERNLSIDYFLLLFAFARVPARALLLNLI
jgi:hypothetical protein